MYNDVRKPNWDIVRDNCNHATYNILGNWPWTVYDMLGNLTQSVYDDVGEPDWYIVCDNGNYARYGMLGSLTWNIYLTDSRSTVTAMSPLHRCREHTNNAKLIRQTTQSLYPRLIRQMTHLSYSRHKHSDNPELMVWTAQIWADGTSPSSANRGHGYITMQTCE